MFMKALDADEMIAQLLASEGFTSLEEVAYVPLAELADIEGFGEEMGQELQTRAREHLERLNRELDEKRRELGVEDAVGEVDGVTLAMMVKFGENDVKSVEDLAYCATDDLTGWTERKDGEVVRYDGILSGMDISAAEAEALIMRARLAVGIVTEEDLASAEAEETEPEAEAEAQESAPADETAEEPKPVDPQAAAEAMFDTPAN